MNTKIFGLALAAIAACGIAHAAAQDAASADSRLELRQFLEDAARNHPRLEGARAELDAVEARGRARSALGDRAQQPRQSAARARPGGGGRAAPAQGRAARDRFRARALQPGARAAGRGTP